MQASSKKALFISVGLHAIFFLSIAFLLLAQSCKAKKELHVFELQTTTPEAVEEMAAKPPTPEAATKEVVKPKAKKKEEPKVAKMTYEEFVKKQGLPQEVKRAPKPVKAPKIDTTDITTDLEKTLAKDAPKLPTPEKALVVDPLKAYAKGLKDQVDAVWEKPIMTLGYKTSALVQFTVHANGTITDIKVKKSSGSLDFDDSIKDAFEKVAKITSPPNGKDMTFELYFNLQTL